jgi:2-keto-4-pentenoate hydratase/2-oxohepta-3-ene-1,7-dioic acid hydratase in catechol pathway
VTTRRYARLALGDGRRAWAELLEGEARLFGAAPWAGGAPTGERVPGVDADGASTSARRLAPVQPSKIVCVGRNYRAHAQELGNDVPPEPLLFFKPPSSLLDPDGVVELPPTSVSARVDHEAELAVVIGQRLRRATEAEAASAVFGLTAAGDITARDLQKKDGQWTRAKGMDTFCPVGPVVVSGLAWDALGVRCRVNGALRQDGSTRDLFFSIPTLLSYASQSMTLEPGDLVLTGTPAGVGPLVDGDALEIEIDGIGVLAARVSAAPST